MSNISHLEKIAKRIRYYILSSTTEAGSGHPTSSLSATDLMTALFFGGYFNFDLDNPEWMMIEEDVWRVAIHHPDDDDVSAVMLSPMDYHVLAGDDLFFSWKGMQVVDRAELIDAADMGGFATKLITGEFIVMTTEYEGELIPPHLRGLVFRTLGEEE